MEPRCGSAWSETPARAPWWKAQSREPTPQAVSFLLLSFEKLVHAEAPRDQRLPVGAVDGHLEVASVRLEAMRQHRQIAGGLLALHKQAIDLVGHVARNAVLHNHQMVELDRAVLLGPALARGFRIADQRPDALLLRDRA